MIFKILGIQNVKGWHFETYLVIGLLVKGNLFNMCIFSLNMSSISESFKFV